MAPFILFALEGLRSPYNSSGLDQIVAARCEQVVEVDRLLAPGRRFQRGRATTFGRDRRRQGDALRDPSAKTLQGTVVDLQPERQPQPRR